MRFPHFLGKCYNTPEEELKKIMMQEPTLEEEYEEEEEPFVGDFGSDASETRTKKTIRFPSYQGAEIDIKNIPVYLPYEAKQALLQQIRKARHHKLHDEPSNPEDKNVTSPQAQVRANYPHKKEEPPIDNRYTRKNSHFLYDHRPVVGYKLPDRPSGSVKKVPRKWINP